MALTSKTAMIRMEIQMQYLIETKQKKFDPLKSLYLLQRTENAIE